MPLRRIAAAARPRLKSFAGWIDHLGHEVRYRVAPEPRSTYASLAARKHVDDPRPIAACDFRSARIDSTGGRYLFNLMHHLVAAGFLPAYRQNYRFLAGMAVKRHKKLLLDLPLCTYAEESSLPRLELLITDSAEVAGRSRAERVVLLDYADRRAGADELPLRFGAHPHIASQSLAPIEADTDAPRPTDVYFAGNLRPGQYDADVIRKKYGLLTRIELIEAIKNNKALPEAFVPRTAVEFERFHEPQKIALLIDHDLRLGYDDWLPAMRRADFFLACPGTRHPMCHNLIEALAVGAVPIVEYDRHLDPPLVDDVNCLAFRGPDEAVEAVRRAIAMPQEERRRLRRGARDYYLEHLAPGRMAERLIAHDQRAMTLLLNEHRAPRLGEAPATGASPIIRFAKAPRHTVALPTEAPARRAA